MTPVMTTVDRIARLTDSAPAAVLLVICAWCTPAAELERLNRQHAGQVSHGLCPPCAERLQHEVA